MAKIEFMTSNEGLSQIKTKYFDESDLAEGEFADYLVDNIRVCFDKSMNTSLIMESIQLFRQWAHERDELESDNYFEVITDINLNGEGNISYNEFQEYVYFDGSAIPMGIRVGIEKIHHVRKEFFLDLDNGILNA